MVEIHGNTYPVREQLKALGGKWNAGAKCWMVPADKAEEAQKIVAGAGPGRKRCGTFRPRTCERCGKKINYGLFCGKCEYA
jgi:hypothetical protein